MPVKRLYTKLVIYRELGQIAKSTDYDKNLWENFEVKLQF